MKIILKARQHIYLLRDCDMKHCKGCYGVKMEVNHFKWNRWTQGLVKGAIHCFRNPYFYFQHGESTFQHGESTSTASQLTSPDSQKSKDLNKVPLLLQDLDRMSFCQKIVSTLK